MSIFILIIIVCFIILLFLGYCKKCHDRPDFVFKCPKCENEYPCEPPSCIRYTTSGHPIAPENERCTCSTGYPDIVTKKVDNKSKTEKFFQLFWGPIYYIIVVIDRIKK